VISGTAGIGKTALAVFWARRVAASYPDGQLYVNLHGFDSGAPIDPTGDALRGFEITRGSRRFFFYLNKLGWLGSILVSVVLTVILILAFRLLNG
jgi:hypothetical protein